MNVSNHPRNFLSAIITAFALFCGTANAAIIYSEGFEDADFGGGTFNTAEGWESTLFVATDTLNELSSSSFASHLDGLGRAFGVIYSDRTATADLEINFEDNTDYTFSFDHFRRNDSISGDAVRAEIRTTSGTILAGETFAAVTGTTASDIQNRVVTFTTNGGLEVGQAIRLVFIDPNEGTNKEQAAIDNIQLTAVVIPEPGSLVLLGIASALFGVTCLRKRKV